MPEKTIYSDENISITAARITSGNATYSVQNIIAVKTICKRPPITAPTLLLLLAIFTLPVWIIMRNPLLFAASASLGIIAFIWRLRCYLKTLYHVSIISAAGESSLFASRDKYYIKLLESRISKTIAKNSQ